jgi:non-ribosomal peptide synthase protein (TIGR01720 family)
VFLHLGQVDAAVAGDHLFAVAEEPTGANRSPSGRRPYLLEVSSAIAVGCLQVEWQYSRHIHSQSTIEGLAQRMLDALRSLIVDRRALDSGGYTPSDFPLAGLDERKLEQLAALLGKASQRKGS